ncbi:lipopolysaccharide biosynthesis protein [Nocardioides sp. InS609-2]|uniref:lipopolysaccharide biosynthesis protein n=1 Tax=Nocardioides sp. InS609-2 TaxID=2760705 RepID=UPI0024A78686|nr:lipopolysaccharide biosynthesis protein [Nocardioides sp. InS609-2]
MDDERPGEASAPPDGAGPPASGLRRSVLRSTAWSTGGALTIRMASLLTGIVAARLLTPNEFGLFAVALVVFTFMGNFADMGIGAAVVRARDDIDRIASTAVTFALINFTGLGVVLALLAPFIARAFGAPDATGALRVMCLYLVLCGPAAVPVGLLIREFRQGQRVVFDFVGLLVSSGLLISLALQGLGEMALAWSRVGGQAFVVIALLVAAKKRYRPGWDRDAAREIMRLGIPLVGASLIGSMLMGVDVFVISRLLGPHEAGVYTLAATIAAWPLGLFLPVLVNVGLPLFAKIRDDRELVGRLLASCLDMIAGVFWPVSAILAGLAPYLVRVLYGDKWSAAAAILSVIAITKAFEAVMSLVADVLIAGGYAKEYMRSQLARLLLVLPAMWLTVPRWGSVSAAWVTIVVLAVVVIPWNLSTCRRMTSLPVVPMFRTSLPPIGGAVAAGLVASWVGAMPDNPWLALLAGGAAGSVVYALLMLRWGLKAYHRTTQLRRAPAVEAQ